MTCNSETCHCFLFAGEIYQDQSGIQDMIDQDDFATRDVFQDDSDEVQIFEDKLLEVFQWKIRILQRVVGKGGFGFPNYFRGTISGANV